MSRSKHFIAQSEMGSWPRHILCVECKWDIIPDEQNSNIEREVFSEYYCTMVEQVKDFVHLRRTDAGYSTIKLWQSISAHLESVGDLTVMSYQCGRIWSLVGLWEMIENGEIELFPDEQSRQRNNRDAVRSVRQDSSDVLGPISSGSLRSMSGRRYGYVVSQDPPNIISGFVPGCKARLTWLDIRNYGIEIPRDVTRGVNTALYLSAIVRDMWVASDEYKLGGLKLTAGSQSLHAWRSGYYHPRVYVHDCESALLLESSAYYGGRCECYRLGDAQEPLHHLDYRSMYPSICVDAKLPVRLIRHIGNPKRNQAIAIILSGTAIATVDIATEEPAYPLLKDGLVIYPVGRFRTSLCGPELIDALRRHRILHIHEIAYYEMEYALRDYAKAIYKMRCDAEYRCQEHIESWAKMLLVCLPGKFGQLDRGWQCEPGEVPPTQWGEWYGSNPTGELVRFRSVGGIVQREVTYGPSSEAVPAMAAWITSLGRMRLLDAIRDGGWEHTYYCDTDAVIVDDTGLERLRCMQYIKDRQLGYMSIKATNADISIHGIKHYRVNAKIVAAGLPRGTCEDAGDGTHFWYQEHPDGTIRNGRRPSSERRLLPYTTQEHYRHGVVNDDGSVSPFRFA